MLLFWDKSDLIGRPMIRALGVYQSIPDRFIYSVTIDMSYILYLHRIFHRNLDWLFPLLSEK